MHTAVDRYTAGMWNDRVHGPINLPTITSAACARPVKSMKLGVGGEAGSMPGVVRLGVRLSEPAPTDREPGLLAGGGADIQVRLR